MTYESAMARRAKLVNGRMLVDSWPSELVPPWGLREMYTAGGHSDVVVLPQLDGYGNEMPTRLDVYARWNGAR